MPAADLSISRLSASAALRRKLMKHRRQILHSLVLIPGRTSESLRARAALFLRLSTLAMFLCCIAPTPAHAQTDTGTQLPCPVMTGVNLTGDYRNNARCNVNATVQVSSSGTFSTRILGSCWWATTTSHLRFSARSSTTAVSSTGASLLSSLPSAYSITPVRSQVTLGA